MWQLCAGGISKKSPTVRRAGSNMWQVNVEMTLRCFAIGTLSGTSACYAPSPQLRRMPLFELTFMYVGRESLYFGLPAYDAV
jgi:hypothetical protein